MVVQYISSLVLLVLCLQARAPNSPVIIVGTHVDQIFSNPERFPSTYLNDLNAVIRGWHDYLFLSSIDRKSEINIIERIYSKILKQIE